MHPSQGLWFPGVMAMAWLLSPARGRLGVWLGIQPQKRGVSKCSVQPGGCQRGRTPHCSDFQSAAFVRHAAKGGSLPAERSIKKHHRFF